MDSTGAPNMSLFNDTNFSPCWNYTRSPQPGTSMYYVGVYIFPVVFVIGACGNALSVIVLNSKNMRSKTNIFLSAMAATDLCFFLIMLLLNLSVFDALAESEAFMKIYFEMKMTLLVLGGWFSAASIW